MKNIYCYILLLISLSFKSYAASPILELNSTGQPPLSTIEQNGFMDELVSEALKRIGYQLNIVKLPAERALKYSNKGIIDGELVRFPLVGKYYKNLIQVPEKIIDWDIIVFSYKPINTELGWAALSQKSVSYINGWKILDKNIPADAEVTKVTNAESLFNMLRRKRTDYIIFERWAGISLLKKYSMNNVQLSKPLFSKGVYTFLHKKHIKLVPKLNKSLSSMKEDGRYQELIKKHLE